MLEDRGEETLTFVTARLRPDVSIGQARAAANVLMNRLVEEYPNTNTGKRVAVDAYQEGGLFPLVRGPSQAFFALMVGVVGLVMLIACVNVAGLLLARGAARRQEIRLRLALGATRSRLVRQLLAESVVLAAIAGGMGLWLARIAQRLFMLVELPGNLPVFLDVRMDPTVVASTVVATVGTVVVFGLFPALQATKTDLASSLRAGGGTESRRAARVRQGVVASQVALSLILLIGAGLLTRSMVRAGEIDPGFEPNNLAVASVDLGLHGYSETAGRQFVRLLRERLLSLPGVRAVGFGEVLPLSLILQQGQVMPEGHVIQEGMSSPSVDYSIVDPGYFCAMGIPIIRGRGFVEDDDEDAPQVVVVNEAFGARFWPGEEAVGRHLQTQGDNYEVVGIVPTGKYFTLGEDPKPYARGGPRFSDRLLRWSPDPTGGIWNATQETELPG